MSRQRQTATVSLFPFLAVLVCAMGALIFLLIVTTRQIREEAVAQKSRSAKTRNPLRETRKEVEKTPVPLPKPKPIEPPPEPEPISIEPIPGLVDLGAAQSTPFAFELPPPPVPEPPPPLPPQPNYPARPLRRMQTIEQVDPDIQLAQRLAELTKSRDKAASQVEEQREAARRLRAQWAALQEQQESLAEQMAVAIQQQSIDEQSLAALKSQEANVCGQLAKVKQQLEEAKQQHAATPPKFRVVPYDGLTGTNYRPITIEFSERGLRFLPEDVLLTRSDFDGFTSTVNPLLAGARALKEYWELKRRQSGGREPEPYVLLLVRPSGAKFYAGRRLLGKLDVPTGYELILEDLPLDLPPLDTTAQTVCREAVETLIRERDDLRSVTRSAPRPSANSRFKVTRRPGGGFTIEKTDPKDRDPLGGATANSRGRAETQQPIGTGRASTSTGNNIAERGSAVNNDPGGQPGRAESGLPTTTPGRFPRTGAERLLNAPPRVGIAKPGGVGLNPPGAAELRENGTTPNGLAGRSSTGRVQRGANRPEPGGRFPSETDDDATAKLNLDPNQPIHVRRFDGSNDGETKPSQQATNAGQPNAGQANVSQPAPNAKAGTTRGGSSNGRSAQNGPEPPFPDFARMYLQQRRRPQRPVHKRWGLHHPFSSIGFERDVNVEVQADKIIIGNAYLVRTDRGQTPDQLSVQVLEAIEYKVRSWGWPPTNFYWVPNLKYQIGPGGNQLYERLRRTSKEWGLDSKVSFILKTSGVDERTLQEIK